MHRHLRESNKTSVIKPVALLHVHNVAEAIKIHTLCSLRKQIGVPFRFRPMEPGRM